MNALQDVKQWLYHLGDVSPSRADVIADTTADLVVTEWASYANEETPYSTDRLDRMRGSTDKIIVSYLSIGEAENYRYYWDDAWENAPPTWIDDANPEWIDNINVRFWNADWQDTIFGYVDRIVTAGFDGVYLDLVSAYEYWEDKNPNSSRNYRADMAEFVAAIKSHAEDKRTELGMQGDFFIIGQNALELINNATYRNAIDGIGKEDLQFYYEYGSPGDFKTLKRGEYSYHLDLLQQAEDAGIATFVVEYIPNGQRNGVADALHQEALDLGDAGTPIYIAGSRDLDGITDQPVAVMNGTFAPLQERGQAFQGTAQNDIMLGSPDSDWLRSGKGGDLILGGRGSDDLRAGDGDDFVFGGRGNDQLRGGFGRDELDGKTGHDGLFGGAGADVLRGGKGVDRLTGHADDDLLRGGEQSDNLRGGKGADDLFGGDGFDVLIGGRGGDVLTGGKGPDIFAFDPGSGQDEITDFNTATDQIALNGRNPGTITVEQGGVFIDMSGNDGIFMVGLDASDIANIDFL